MYWMCICIQKTNLPRMHFSNLEIPANLTAV